MNFREKKCVLFIFPCQDMMSYYFLISRTPCPIEGLENVKHCIYIHIYTSEIRSKEDAAFSNHEKGRGSKMAVKKKKKTHLFNSRNKINFPPLTEPIPLAAPRPLPPGILDTGR